MSNLDDDTPKQDAGNFPPTEPTAPPNADVENKSPGTTPTVPRAPQVTVVEKNKSPPGTMFGVSAIVQRWKRRDFMKSGSLVLTGLAFLFSLMTFIIMAASKSNGIALDQLEAYRYEFAIAILATVYTGGKALRQVRELWTGKRWFQQRTSALLDFFGDQIMAYLLMSAASSAAPTAHRLRHGIEQEATDRGQEHYSDWSSSYHEAIAFVDTLAASISMAFLAFFALAFSAIVSGYKLSTQSYI